MTEKTQAAAQAATQGTSQTEAIVENVIKTVQEGKTGDFFAQLWEKNSDTIIHLLKVILLAAAVVLIAWLFCRIARKYINKTTSKLPVIDGSTNHLMYVLTRTVIWLFAFLIILDLLGINTASILTVLGAVGLTVALAMKDSMSNIAAGVMLIILRPYKTGDFVECGSVAGSIKTMGLFSTEIETVDGIFVAVPNSAIFGTPVKNYSRNAMRRADITVGIAYGDDLTKGVEVLRKLMLNNDLILKDPLPEVLVAELADSSVNLTLRFWTANENYWQVYWQVKSEIKPALENSGLNIPFPQRVITFVNKAE